jgi:hypothetical protein
MLLRNSLSVRRVPIGSLRPAEVARPASPEKATRQSTKIFGSFRTGHADPGDARRRNHRSGIGLASTEGKRSDSCRRYRGCGQVTGRNKGLAAGAESHRIGCRRGRNRTNVWNYPGMSSFGRGRDELLGMHPTVKPVSMIADALRDVTRRGDVVLDTFAGSGSVLMAAQETGRICCCVELDPLYLDVAVRRWQNVTGREAVRLETGESFNSIAQRLLDAPQESSHGQ